MSFSVLFSQAVTYNDKSIQENYHVSSFFHLCLKNSACNIFEAFPDEDYRRCRTLIVEVTSVRYGVVFLTADPYNSEPAPRPYSG